MASKRDYKAEYRRRHQRARARGFSGYAQQRRFSAKLRSPKDLARLPESARSARSDALRVLNLSRVQGISIEQAAHEDMLPVDVVRFWAGDALEPKRRGLTLARRGDRMLRLRPIFLTGVDAVRFVAIHGSRASDRAGEIFDVQYRFIQGEASLDELAGIAGERVAGRTVEADPGRLITIGEVGGADIVEAYREVLG